MNTTATASTALVTPSRDSAPLPHDWPVGSALALPELEHGLMTETLEGRTPIALEELDHVALLDRMDAKYLLNQRQADEFLNRLDPGYRVLEIDGRRVHGYRTLYFDTADFAFYRAHHNGRANRYKVRSREYRDSGLTFFEVKQKDGRGRTRKFRQRTSDLVTAPGPCEQRFLEEHLPVSEPLLLPAVHNTFSRVTLANLQVGERITIDGHLAFTDGGNVAILPGLVVAEVKTGTSVNRSPAALALRSLNIRPAAFSKYCIGVALLRRDQKHNRFKPQLLRVDRLIGGAP